MCLLINQPKNLPAISNEWLTDFYYYNSDGIGVMYSNGRGRLVVQKALPRDEGELIEFYHRFIAGKACAWHLRMRTHGGIDLANCHPYPVLNFKQHGIDLQIMHNGVLHTGNHADDSMSDTHHFVARFLTPILADNPSLIFNKAFQELLADQIGAANKFILVDSLGRTVVINESAGVRWGGLWLSNTYAWSAPGSVISKLSKWPNFSGGKNWQKGKPFDPPNRAELPVPGGERRVLANDAYADIWEDTSWTRLNGYDYM